MADTTLKAIITGSATGAVRAFNEAALASEATSKKIGDNFDRATSKVGGAFHQLANAAGTVFAPAGVALDGIGKKFDDAKGKGNGFFQTLSNAGGVASVAVAAGFVAVAGESIKMATSFQSSMELIHTQAGATQGEVQKMSSAVLDLAGPTATAPDELAAGLFHLESAGMRGQTALDALKVAAEGAKVGHADLESVTNALNASIASGIPGVQNLQGAMGSLNAIVGSGDMRMQDLADALGTGVLAAVKGFGLNLNDVGAALATFGDNNIRGQNAAQALRQTVMAFAKPASTAKAALGGIGMSVDQLGKDMQTGGLKKAITDLHTHLVATGNDGVKAGALLTNAFGKRAGVGIQVLEDQFSRFQSKTKEVAQGSGHFGEAWNATTQTLSFQMDQAKATVQALGTKFGEFLIPKLEAVMKAGEKVITFLEHHKKVAEALAAVIGGVLAVAIGAFAVNMGVKFVKSVQSAGQAIGKLGSKIVEMIPGFGEAEVAEGEFAATSEATGEASSAAFGPVGIAIMAIVLVGTLIATHWKLVRHLLEEAWNGIKDAAVAVWDFIKNHLKQIGEAILIAITGPVGVLVLLLIKNWKTISDDVSAAWEAIIGFFKAIPGRIIGALSSLASMVVSWVSSVYGAITGALSSGVGAVMNFFTNLPGKILGWLGDGAKVLLSWGSDLINGIVSGIESIAGKIGDTIKNAITSGINTAKNALNSIPVVGGVFSAIGLATGGVVTKPTLAVVGENEPEAVLPQSWLAKQFGTGVTPLSFTTGAFSAFSTPTAPITGPAPGGQAMQPSGVAAPVITINGFNLQNPNETASAVGWELRTAPV
jgi:TP901 family phage tail tape measure protein